MVCQGGSEQPTPSPPGTAQCVLQQGWGLSLCRHPVDYWGAVCASPEMETHVGKRWGGVPWPRVKNLRCL